MRILNKSGLSLLEVVISIGLVSLVMTALMTMTQIVNNSSLGQNIIMSRNEIVNSIRQQATRYSNLEHSALMTRTLGSGGLSPNIGEPNVLAHSDMLARCLPSITIADIGGCDRSGMDDSGRGNLFYLGRNNSEEPELAVSGEDVFYTLSAKRCTQLEAQNPRICPLYARTWAEPFCLDFATNCNKAMSLTIRYAVGVRSDYPNSSSYAIADGQIYMPLQKGIQMSRLLNENDGSILPNTNGIYVLKKNNGYPNSDPTGLRFEVIVGNPTGLQSMKLQQRLLTGPDAYGLPATSIPNELESKPWTDVPTPPDGNLCGIGAGSWSISLLGASPNQVLKFGTMTNPIGASTNQKFCFSSHMNNISGLSGDPVSDWNFNGAALIPPIRKSGFYQFRVMAVDITGSFIESTNYITVRMISSPKVFPPFVPALLDRNCTANHNVVYNFGVADDEKIEAIQLQNLAGILPAPAVDGSSMVVPITFDLSLPTGPITYTLTAKNFFTDQPPVNGITPYAATATSTATLKDVLMNYTPAPTGLTSNPAKIRINNTAELKLSYSIGSCCQVEPSVNWTYQNVPPYGIMLSGPAQSAVTCTEVGNLKNCESTTTILGIAEGPGMASNNVLSALSYTGDPPSACEPSGSNLNSGNYFQVINIPTIYFFSSESLWLTMPSGPIGLKAKNPIAWIKLDFQPTESITVKVVKAEGPRDVQCEIPIVGGSGTAAIYRSCTLDPNYSGDYLLAPGTANILTDGQPMGPTYVAKISGQISHRACNANVADLAEFNTITNVAITQPMYNSPWGATVNHDGSLNQDPFNDTNLWNAGQAKTLRCYDNWNNGVQSTSFTNNFSMQDAHALQLRLFLQPRDDVNRTLTIGYSSFKFPNNTAPDLSSVDYNTPNAPSVFVVMLNGTPGGVKWRYSGANNEAAETSGQNWSANLANQLCTGNAALSKVGLYQSKMKGYAGNNVIMTASNSLTASTHTRYSYAFMCTYGRWNPRTRNTTNWVH